MGSSAAYWSRAPAPAPLPGAVGEVSAGVLGVRVLGAEDPLPCFKESLLEFPCGGVTAALAEVVREPGQADAVIGKGCLGMR
jgi:hypothetical protein